MKLLNLILKQCQWKQEFGNIAVSATNPRSGKRVTLKENDDDDDNDDGYDDGCDDGYDDDD